MLLLQRRGQYNRQPARCGWRGLVVACIRCGSERTRRDGQTRVGGQCWRCHGCGRRVTARSASAFSGRGCPDDLIALAVRWSVRYRRSSGV